MFASDSLEWKPESALAGLSDRLVVERDVAVLCERIVALLEPGDQVLLMSNGSFQGLPRLLQQALQSRDAAPVAN